MFLVNFATVVACNFLECKYLLVEPETTDKSCLAEYEIAMRKLQMLSIIKNIGYCTNAEQRSKVNANNEAEVTDLLHGFKEQHKKRIKLFDKYLSSVVIQNVTNDDFKPVKNFYVQCLKSFPPILDFFSFFRNFSRNKKVRLSSLMYSSCVVNYEKCLVEFIFYRMQKILSKREDLIEIWHKLIRQIYLDTMCTQKLHEWSNSQDGNVNAIEVNAPIFCIKSKNFFKDTIDYINNIAKTYDNVEGLNIVLDISPLLVLHFIKYAKKEHNTIETPPFSEELLIDVISYLTTDKKYIESLEPISMPKIKHLAFSGYPIELSGISDILTVAKIDVGEYQKCFRAALVFSYIVVLSTRNFYDYCFMKKETRKIFFLLSKKKLHLQFYKKETEKKYTLLRITAHICEGLTVKLICGGERPFSEFDSIEAKNFEHYDVFDGPINQDKIKQLYTYIAGIRIEDVQKEKDLELDLSPSFVGYDQTSGSSLVYETLLNEANMEVILRKKLFAGFNSRSVRSGGTMPTPKIETLPKNVENQAEMNKQKAKQKAKPQNFQRSEQNTSSTKNQTMAHNDDNEAPKLYAGQSKARTRRYEKEGDVLRRAKNKERIFMWKGKSMTKDEVMDEYVSLEAKYTAVAEDLITARTVLEKADINVINARIDLERSKLDLDQSMSDLKNTRSAGKITKAVVDVKKAKAVLSDATKKFEYSILDKKIALEAIELCEQRQIKILNNAAHLKAEETAFFEQCFKDQLAIINQNAEICHAVEDTCNPKNDAMSQKEDEMLVNSSNPTGFAKTGELVTSL